MTGRRWRFAVNETNETRSFGYAIVVGGYSVAAAQENVTEAMKSDEELKLTASDAELKVMRAEFKAEAKAWAESWAEASDADLKALAEIRAEAKARDAERSK